MLMAERVISQVIFRVAIFQVTGMELVLFC